MVKKNRPRRVNHYASTILYSSFVDNSTIVQEFVENREQWSSNGNVLLEGSVKNGEKVAFYQNQQRKDFINIIQKYFAMSDFIYTFAAANDTYLETPKHISGVAEYKNLTL